MWATENSPNVRTKAYGKMRICGSADFQTCKMRMVLRIFFADMTGKLRMRTQYYKLKINYILLKSS